MLGLAALTKAVGDSSAEATISKLDRRDLAIAMRLYANDLEDNPEAYKNWYEAVDNVRRDLTDHPVFVPGRYYARKTVTVHAGKFGFVLEPYINPRQGDKVWVADPCEPKGYTDLIWTGSDYEKRLLLGGLVHSSLQRALDHADALYKLTASITENVQRAVRA